MPVELVLWTMITTTPCGVCSFEMWERGSLPGGFAGTGWHMTSLPPGSPMNPTQSWAGCWQAAVEDTVPRTAANIVTEWQLCSRPPNTLSGIGSARNNYLVIRNRQQAEAFCEIASYSLHVSLGMNLWDICKRKVNAQGPKQVAFKTQVNDSCGKHFLEFFSK